MAHIAKIETTPAVKIHGETDLSQEKCLTPEGSRDFDETSPALMAQIREGYQEFLRGETRPVEEFMAELEAELANEQ